MKDRREREREGEPFTGGEILPWRWKTEAAALGECGARARGGVYAETVTPRPPKPHRSALP
jgi:hypothetical protein